MTECIAEHCDRGISHQHLPSDEGIGKYVALGYCFNCSHWQDLADKDRINRRAFVVRHLNGELWHYIAGTKQGGNFKSRGMYGRRFRIVLDHESSPIYTEDLWHQGAVPEAWEHLFERVPHGRFTEV